MPPFVGVAVNVTFVPEQVGLEPVVSAMETDGAAVGVTDMVIPVLVAVKGLAQVALDVRIHVITCPFISAVVVKVGLLVPTLAVPTFHW